ncbi:MAG TPA: DNA mismatch repair endonuclease MutL [Bacteroidales bacterium]|nr:DNA mismatch repair endonuclease MutL [Bacteroidales bacterium]
MTNIIKLLPSNISNQIAAGEVIQRPASVVKELIENAIDAKATHIQLIVKDAGKTLIQITDNGTGMNEEDALISFERHATSKVKTSQDLFQIKTMGFRGEALASIAAIAHVEMKTKQENDELGNLIEMEGNECKSKHHISCEKGTSIAVKNLFYNVPARRNFLKSDTVENNHILNEFLNTALIHNDIAFTYYNNDKLIHKLEKQNIKKRIIDLFGKSFNERLLPIEEEMNSIKISGFIVKAEYAKKNKSEQFFFVNKRFMRNHYLANSIDRAYQGLIPEKTYPAFFISIEIDPESIDVNIHPTKTEIKFLDDKVLYALLHAATKRSLGQFTLAAQLDFNTDKSFEITPIREGQMINTPQTNFDPNFNPFDNNTQSQEGINIKSSFDDSSNWANMSAKGLDNNNQLPFKKEKLGYGSSINIYSVEENLSQNQNYSDKHPEVIQVQNKYIITKTKNSILVINQERASQRILFEKFSNSQYDDISCQQLLFPYNHFFSPSHTSLLLELLSEIRKYGFMIEYQKEGSFNITGVPNNLSSEDAQIVLENLLYEINENNEIAAPKHYKVALSMSKRLCIKEGQILRPEDMLGIVGQLFSSQNCETTPWGKKILHKIEVESIDNIFE